MQYSQNATFLGRQVASASLDDDACEAFILDIIAAGLKLDSWVISEIEDWRDSGVVVQIHRDETILQIIIAAFPGIKDRWILQISPFHAPGAVGRMLGRASSATPEAVHYVAVATKSILTEAGFHDFHWRWNDLADRAEYPSEPPAPPWKST